MSQKSVLSSDAERVLFYLARTTDPHQRTRRALIANCQFKEAALFEAAARELVASGYAQETAGCWDATHNGTTFARALDPQKATNPLPKVDVLVNVDAKPGARPNEPVSEKSKSQAANTSTKATGPNPRVMPASVEEGDTQNIGWILPLPNAHPMRANSAALSGSGRDAAQDASTNAHPVCFTLAFDQHRYALPVPVLNRDVLGRGREAHICIKNDSSISRIHCRFSIKFEKNGVPRLYVEDLNSRCGTLLEGQRIVPGILTLTKQGNRITVGSTILIVTMIPYGTQ